MLPAPRINITLDFSSIILEFQDVRYIGELRQRWEEIKKLQKSLGNITSISNTPQKSLLLAF